MTLAPGVSVSAVVPTTGASPHLDACLEALRRDAGSRLEIVVVYQGSGVFNPPPDLVDIVHREPKALGFAAATNLGIAKSRARFLATINDDAIIDPGWLSDLVAVLESDPDAAAAQGVNLRLGRPHEADGWGLGWSRRWQAQQLGYGASPLDPASARRELFGVSATAALYRRAALDQVALPSPGAGQPAQVFDPRLDSYYEDVDLACRLRSRGHRAWLLPRVRAHHAGSTTGNAVPGRRLALVYGNRYLVLARLLGRAFWRRLPLFVLRDLREALGGARGGEPGRGRAVLAGWWRAATVLPRFAHRGPASLDLEELWRLESEATGAGGEQ